MTRRAQSTIRGKRRRLCPISLWVSAMVWLLDPQLAVGQFRSDVRLVVIHATVTDRRGVLVRNLSAGAFRVLEDGRPQTLKESVREDVPVTLGMLMDESGSTTKYRAAMVDALDEVAGAMKPDDEIFVAHFGMFLSIDLAPTPPPADLRARLAGMVERYKQPLYPVGTRLFDSVQQASAFVEKSGQRDKRVLLLITDGKDTTSLLNLKQLVASCRRSETLVYGKVLYIAIGFDREIGKKTLDQITAAAGGHAFYPDRPADLPGIALRIAQEIRTQYTLTYSPDSQAADGAWRAIRVEIAQPSGLTVRCRSGYYAGRGE